MMTEQLNWRNRIVEHRLVHADDIKEHPFNWRTHPNAQAEALEGVLDEVGIVDELKVYHSERNGGALTLMDGALRRSRGGLWPVTVLDINDAEADLMITVFDPISALAGTNSEMLDTLLHDINTGNSALQGLMSDIATKAGLYEQDVNVPQPDTQKEPALRAETLIEIYCTQADLRIFQGVLDEWSQRPTVTLNIS